MQTSAFRFSEKAPELDFEGEIDDFDEIVLLGIASDTGLDDIDTWNETEDEIDNFALWDQLTEFNPDAKNRFFGE